MSSDILVAVRDEIVRTTAVESTRLDAATRLDDVGIDNLDRIELRVALEVAFDIELDDAAFMDLATVGAVGRAVADEIAVKLVGAARSVA